MRLLVTGANGFLGRNLLRRFQKDATFDLCATSWSPQAAVADVPYRSACLGAPNFLENVIAFGPCDAIVHAAAALPGGSDDRALVDTNCHGFPQAYLYGHRGQYVDITHVALPTLLDHAGT